MEDIRQRLRDEISPNDLWLWRRPGWQLEKLKLHPFGRYFLNVGMNAEAFVITDEKGNLVKLKVWSYHR